MIAPSAFFLVVSLDPVGIAATVGAGAGLYLFLRGFHLLSRKQLILNTPTSKVRSAALGMVEVNGLAVGPYTITAPISGRVCYYYRTVAWQRKQQDGKTQEWVKVAEESLHVPFYLDDNSGKVLVNPLNAELDIHRDFADEFSNSFFSGKDRVPEGVTRFLMRHGVDPDKRIRIEEYCIKPKNALFILGTLAENPGLKLDAAPTPMASHAAPSVQFKIPPKSETVAAGSAHRAAAAVNATTAVSASSAVAAPPVPQEVVRLSSPDEEAASRPTSSTTLQSKIAAAMMKAGLSNPLATATGVARSTVAINVPEPGNGKGRETTFAKADFDLNPKVVLMKGSAHPAFFISWRSQREVIARLGWQSTAFIWGGPALTLICAYILALHFEWL